MSGMSERRKTGLVVLFNHNYEKNIPLIKEVYGERFSDMRILMPFYYGEDEKVLSVYGNSFLFQNYIVQVREKLMAMDCDDFLIIGDDVYLNPDINGSNLHEKLSLSEGSFYIDKVHDVSLGEYSRPVVEASRFSPGVLGLDTSANRILPSYEEAYSILKQKGVIGSTRLSRWKLFFRRFRKPFFRNFAYNRYVFLSRCYHILKWLQYRIKPVKMPYPYVFGYSDLIVVPREKMIEWCRYLEIFASWGMFVEMAIPTAMLLVKDALISFSDNIAFKTGNVWYTQGVEQYYLLNNIIDKIHNQSSGIADIARNFPREYLYLHPLKLSRYAGK